MPTIVWSYLTVALGGAIGAMARYTLSGVVLTSSGSIPLGTLVSNLLGCLFMGVIAQLAAGSPWFNDAGFFPDHYRLLFAVGFCGSFTTLSALVFEMSEMLQRELVGMAFVYFAATMLGAFACFYVGATVVRLLLQSQ